jgi:hypothetical protein
LAAGLRAAGDRATRGDRRGRGHLLDRRRRPRGLPLGAALPARVPGARHAGRERGRAPGGERARGAGRRRGRPAAHRDDPARPDGHARLRRRLLRSRS